MARAAGTAQVPIFLPYPYTEDLFSKQKSQFLFRITPGADTLVRQMITYLAEITQEVDVSIKNVSIFRPQIGVVNRAAAVMKQAIMQQGWDIAVDFTYPIRPSRPKDFMDPASQARSQNSDLVIYMGGYFEAAAFVKAIHNSGVKPKAIVGNFSVAFSNPTLVNRAGDLYLDVMDVNFWWDPKHRSIETLQGKFIRQFPEPLSNNALHAYTVIYLLRDALRRTGTHNPRKLAVELRQLQFSQHLLAQRGPIKFDDHGRNVNAEPVLLQVMNPKVKIIYPKPFSQTAAKIRS
jgi:ABC-type branched-subunit amino acid transport system substrate-binding protein